MATQWYLIQGDDDFGPMTSDELKKLAADRKIGPRDLVRKEGTTRWFPATAVEGLLPTPITTPSAPPVRTSSPGSYFRSSLHRHPRSNARNLNSNLNPWKQPRRASGAGPAPPGSGSAPGRHC